MSSHNVRALSTIVSGHSECTVYSGGFAMHVTTYQIDRKHVCIIENADPRATICRVCGDSKDESVRMAMDRARTYVEDTKRSRCGRVPKLELNLGWIEQLRPPSKMTIDEFLGLPGQERMELVFSGNLLFYSEAGSIVASGMAMELLNKACMEMAA